jgi:hypothetical protein
MPPDRHNEELKREDANAELTKLLLHGHGALTIKVHAHRITALDTTTRQIRACRGASESEND